MKNIEIKIETTYDLTQQDVDDLMSTALEGGINYWCRKATVKGNISDFKVEFSSDVISQGGTLILHDAESNDKWELNLEKLVNGIKMFCQKKNKSVEDLINDFDAFDVDAVIQYGIFGKLVFG